MERRRFLEYTGWALAGGGLVWVVSRFVRPQPVTDLSRRITVCSANELPGGAALHLPELNIHVLHGDSGLYALSGRCSHLGCSVLKQPEGFSCPCHGGRFDQLGQPTAGPPTRPLTWVKLTIGADHTIVLHLDQQVEPGTIVRA
jgi:Rieske Fe-S protein